MPPDLVVCLPDGRTFTRRGPSPQVPPGNPDAAAWARFMARTIERLIEVVDDEGESIESVTRRYATRDFARDALLGWAQWSETPVAKWVDE